MSRRLLGSMGEMAEVAGDLVLGRYPAFVYGGALRDREVPVFVLHSADPATFGPMVEYLSANRYHTLTADELWRLLCGDPPSLPGRCIALTFDDGMASVWTVAFPLLKRYGLTATVFLVPGRIRDTGSCRPTLEDAWAGRVSASEVVAAEAGDDPLATWPEVEAMHRSGIIACESHSLTHTLVFTAPELIGFVSPQGLAQFHPFEFSFAHLYEEGGAGVRPLPPLGTPIFRAASRLGAARRFIDAPGLRECCIGHVAQSGGAAFFDRPDWERELRALAAGWRRSHGKVGRYETEVEQRGMMRNELRESRRMIETRLLGKEVRHFCYPWLTGSSLAEELLAESGYRSAHLGRVARHYINRVGDPPFRIRRLGSDFLLTLPGSGRRGLASVIRRKLRRRLTAGSPYLSHA